MSFLPFIVNCEVKNDRFVNFLYIFSMGSFLLDNDGKSFEIFSKWGILEMFKIYKIPSTN
jgi:hypothetical protein